MQTTLLGLAIALILALLSALLAPLVVDWDHYRAAVEREASRLTGLDVHVNGKIDARLLPSPIIMLRDVDFAAPGEQPKIHADTLELELAPTPLLRGEVQASNMHIVAPQLTLAVDASGAVQWPGQSGIKPVALSIAHLTVEDGRITLADAVSGGHIVLEKVWFNGDIGALRGPFAGEGAVVVGDELYGYRISGSPAQGAPGTKIRFSVDPSNRPLTTDFDGMLTFDHGVPQFDGTMTVARPVGATLANGQRVVSEPWQAGGTIKATPAAVSLQHGALRYGPEERALNFTGDAELTLGAQPHLRGEISALQLDVDRALANPDVTNRLPFVVLRNFLQKFAAAASLPVAAQIGVGIDGLTIGGTNLESLHGDVLLDRDGLGLQQFKFRAPGMTDINVSGRLTHTAQGFAFSGPASMQSADLDRLMAWLNGHGSDQPTTSAKAISAQGDVTIASDRMAIEKLSASLGQQENITGQLSYDWPAANRPAQLDAELRAATLDIDALTTFARAAAGSEGLAVPQQGKLALDIGKATFAGVDAQAVNAQVKFDAGRLQIDRLSVGDLGGATLAVNGRIDELSSQPRGLLTLDLDARSLGGLSNIAARFAPQAAASLRHAADALAPAKVHAVLTVEHAAAAGSIADLQITGTLAAMRLSVDGKATGEPAHLGDAVLQAGGEIDADDGSALVALLGLDHVLGVDQLPAQLMVSAGGPLNGDIHVSGKVAASGLSSTIGGALNFSGDHAPAGRLQLQAAAADLRPLRQALTGRAGDPLAVAAHATLAVSGADISFNDVAATLGQSAVKAKLAVHLASPMGISGDVTADSVDAASMMAMLLGFPGNPPGATTPWSSTLAGKGAFGGFDGAVNFRFDRVGLTPSLIANGLGGVARFRGSGITLDNIAGSVAGGRVTGALAFSRDPNGLTAHATVGLDGVAAASVLGPALNLTSGTLSTALQLDGFGTSLAGVIGSLHGGGTLKLNDAQFAGLSVAAFGAAFAAAADQSGAFDMAKVQTAVTAALANGRVAVAQGDAPVTITAGAMSLTHATLPAERGAQLGIDGAIDLGNQAVDAHVTLSEAPPANALIPTRPQLSLALKGPLSGAQRTLDTSGLTNWLTLNSAELQTRRIEMIEANQRLGALGGGTDGHVLSPDVHIVPSGTVVEFSAPPGPLAAPPSGTGGVERLLPPGAPIAPDQIRPNSGAIDRGPTAAAVPLPAPPPKEIKRTPPPTASSSIFDFLLRPHD